MFSKETPYNDLPLLPPKINYDDVDILKAVNATNIALSELKGISISIPNQQLLLQPLTLREAVASNKIENIHTTVTEVLKSEVLSETEIRLPEKETLYYRQALLFGLKAVKEGQLTVSDISRMQAIVETENNGLREKETGKMVRIRNRSTGAIIYTPPDEKTALEKLLQNLEAYYNDTDDPIDVVVRAAILHYQFEAIHPFRDGNGRIGRILMVLYFVLQKRLDMPLLFISSYLLANRSEYYRLLAFVTEHNDWKEFVLFILKGVERQSRTTKDIILSVDNLIKEYKKIANIHNLPTDFNFVDYLFSNPFYTYNHLAEGLSVHRNTAVTYLKKLEATGILKSMKVERESVFYYDKFLNILSQ